MDINKKLDLLTKAKKSQYFSCDIMNRYYKLLFYSKIKKYFDRNKDFFNAFYQVRGLNESAIISTWTRRGWDVSPEDYEQYKIAMKKVEARIFDYYDEVVNY